MSHIIYLDGVPYHVENDHKAQPLPEHLHQRFRYTPATQGNAPANVNRPQPFGQHDNDRHNEPPVYRQDEGGDQYRKRDEPVPNIRDRDRERIEQPPQSPQPPFERGPREGERGSDASTGFKGRTAPVPDQPKLPLPQAQPNAGESHAATPSVKERDRIGNRPQAVDDSAKKKTDKKKPRFEKKDKKGESPQADEGRGNKKDNIRD
jgi:hypothetical protein